MSHNFWSFKTEHVFYVKEGTDNICVVCSYTLFAFFGGEILKMLVENAA